VTLSHKKTGEWLTLMLDQTCRFMMHDEFVTHYCGHREPGVAEQRLREFFPHGQGLSAVLHTLARSGMVRGLPAEFELASRVDRHVRAILNFLERWRDPTERLWLAVAVGDWPAAHEAAVVQSNSELVALLAPLAEQCRQRWRKWLRRQVARHGIDWVDIETLARAGVVDSGREITGD
jgi:hypothetical protein